MVFVLACLRVAAPMEAQQNTQRRDALLALQASAQRKWADERIFEADAPEARALAGARCCGRRR